MKRDELIKLLQEIPENLDVYMYADHGQVRESVYSAEVAYIDTKIDLDGFTTDPDDAEEWGYKKKVIMVY